MPTHPNKPHASPRHQARAAAHPHAPTPARRAAALAICLALLGAGCSNATNHTTYTPTWTPPATASASPTPTLSPEDAAARATALAMEPPAPYTPEFTPEGAATAATYFLNLYPYVYATGDLDAWQNMSEDDCEFCNSVISNVTELHDAGGWADSWEQEIAPLEYWMDDADPNRYVVRTQVSYGAHASYSGDGASSTQTNAADEILLVQMRWTESDWTVEVVDIEETGDSE
ncbi:MAG: hypothetical protein I3J03_07360 [Actinomyces succiniciruminis]|nr:hypothetical protein [Actinomyces succiniciruminis]